MGWSARPLSSENGSPGGSGGTCGWGGGPSPSPLVFKKFRIGVLPSRTVDGNDPQLQIRFPPCLSLPWRFLFLFSQDRRRSYAPQPTLPQGSAHHPPNDCTPKPNPNSLSLSLLSVGQSAPFLTLSWWKGEPLIQCPCLTVLGWHFHSRGFLHYVIFPGSKLQNQKKTKKNYTLFDQWCLMA